MRKVTISIRAAIPIVSWNLFAAFDLKTWLEQHAKAQMTTNENETWNYLYANQVEMVVR